MDCRFRILTKNQELFEELKKYADGWSEKGLIIVNLKCNFLDILKSFDVEVLITPYRIGEGEVNCIYFDGNIMWNCNDEIIEKFNIEKYEPIIWKEIEEEDLPF